MPAGNLFAVIVRPGKNSVTQAFTAGDSLESVLQGAGLNRNDYNSWTFTDEDGDALKVGDRLRSTTTIICGQRVDGAR